MPTNLANTTVSGNQNGTPTGTTSGANQNSAPVAMVPFIRASGLHRETMYDKGSITLGTSSQDLGTIDVPAYGYLRAVVFTVEASGGSGSTTAGVMADDAPWNVLNNITFQEPDGSTIAQFNSGYDLYLANKYGGYRAHNDPKLSIAYSAPDDGGNFRFQLRIPLELSARDGLGSLPNQNSAAQFKVRATIGSADTVFSTSPDTVPSVSLKMSVECWDQPQPNNGGVANETEPPASNTTQYWNPQQYNITSGESSPRLTRMGNYVRNWVFVFRDDTGARTDDWPNPCRIYLDARPKDVVRKTEWQNTIYERYGLTGDYDSAGGPDTGVWPYDFCHEFDGNVGFENRDLWLPTLGSTRVEVEGNFPTSGKLHVHTNDVSIAGTVWM